MLRRGSNASCSTRTCLVHGVMFCMVCLLLIGWPKVTPSAVHARMFRHAQQQELHLVGEDASVFQDESLVPIRYIGHVEQRHARLLGRAVALAVVACSASRDEVR